MVIACLLHAISNGALLRSDHGYWGAKMIAPTSPKKCGPDFSPPEYLHKAHDEARSHRWYMNSRLITIYDVYSFQEGVEVDPDIFTDIIGRNFRESKE